MNDKPYYLPVSFEADTASFTFTFPETEAGIGWHAFTMPFRADSIFLDSTYVALDDANKHFWIYEFSAQGNNGEAVFTPAKELRSGTPYIIAADITMAGRSIVFRSLSVPFYKSGTDKMLVTTNIYKFHGNTLSPRVKDCYILNADGTAFEYVTANTLLTGLAPYFTTPLSEEEALALPGDVFNELFIEAVKAYTGEKPTVETEPVKKTAEVAVKKSDSTEPGSSSTEEN